MKKESRFPLRGVFLLISLFVWVSSSMAAAPDITKVELGTAVGTGYNVAAFDLDQTAYPGICAGIWVDAGATSADTTSTIPTNAGLGGCQQRAATMGGTSMGYGTLLLSLDANNLSTEATALTSNKPTNANTTMFGASTGPVNKTNISLNRAGIAAGTSVTFTVNMNGGVPHLVAVMGGSAPVITYDATANSGNGQLTVQTTTFDTTNQAGESFSSIVGFSILTDTSLGSTPMKVIAQTNHWVGDIFPLFPGMDSNAKNSGIGGTQGSYSAKCGTTFYGPAGQSRTVSLFIANASIGTIFGGNVTEDMLTGFKNTSVADGVSIATGTTNFSATGPTITFGYTFSSPADTTIGVPDTAIASIPTLTQWAALLLSLVLVALGYRKIRYS